MGAGSLVRLEDVARHASVSLASASRVAEARAGFVQT